MMCSNSGLVLLLSFTAWAAGAQSATAAQNRAARNPAAQNQAASPGLPAAAVAIPASSSAQQPMRRAVGNNTYVLGSGDQISLRVQDMDEIPDRPIRIDPDGAIDLPLAGRVQAAGLTLAELRLSLADKLRKYITDPQVSANLVENQSRPVSVIGEVGQPGVHQLQGPRNLIEVISEAGGTKPEAGPRVILTRQSDRGPLPLPGAMVDETGNFSTASISLDELMSSKNPAQNITIQPNDVISIPKGDVVYVVGWVARPGGFPLQSHETISLLQAVSLAQGIKPDAAQGSAKILRQRDGGPSDTPEEIPVDVKRIFAGKAPDVRLRANDILFIPGSAAKAGGRRAIDAIVQVATGVAIYAR